MASNRLIAPRSQLLGDGRSLPPAVTPAHRVSGVAPVIPPAKHDREKRRDREVER
jgi:hypothetical protein